jgi:hypothetical protein
MEVESVNIPRPSVISDANDYCYRMIGSKMLQGEACLVSRF